MEDNKKILTTKDAAIYLGVSQTFIRKMCMNRELPYYKSRGGKLNYFKVDDLDSWAMAYRVSTNNEMEEEVSEHLKKGAI